MELIAARFNTCDECNKEGIARDYVASNELPVISYEGVVQRDDHQKNGNWSTQPSRLHL